MAKDKTAFFCRECGAKSAVWIGRCPQCGAWNSYEQEVIHRSGSGQLKNLSTPKAVTMLMSNIECSNEQRIDLKDDELNRVLGGGLVLGSLVLIGGEPGIGKSTLLLQVALNCKDKRVLYVSGEESASQIKMRAERINKGGGNCYVLTETCVENIESHRGTTPDYNHRLHSDNDHFGHRLFGRKHITNKRECRPIGNIRQTVGLSDYHCGTHNQGRQPCRSENFGTHG